MSSSYIYQGVWSKWDGHPWTTIWTVTNFSAIIIMGVITTLLAATQSRIWVIIRHLYLRFARPNRLPDDLDALSQLKALKMIWVYLDKKLRPSRYRQQSLRWEYDLPVWMGLWAAMNILGFLAAGVILPWFLTEGFLGAPEVRSRRTYSCEDAWCEG
jgi:hypothetical protein